MSAAREGQTRMGIDFGRSPFGLHGRLQWYAADKVPSLVARAAKAGGFSSSAHYIRTALLQALERDLGIDFEKLNAEQPTKASNKIYLDPLSYGASCSSEDVR